MLPSLISTEMGMCYRLLQTCCWGKFEVILIEFLCGDFASINPFVRTPLCFVVFKECCIGLSNGLRKMSKQLFAVFDSR